MQKASYSPIIGRILSVFLVVGFVWFICIHLFVVQGIVAARLGPLGQIARDILSLTFLTVVLSFLLRRAFREVAKGERDARASEERVKAAIEAAGDGIWENNFMFSRDFYGDRIFTMLGFPPVTPYDAFALFQDRMHPDDRAAWQAANTAIQKPGNDHFELVFRVRHRDGHWCHILSRGQCIERTENGKPARMVGTHTEVTAQCMRERELGITCQTLQTALEAMPWSIAVVDANWEIPFANDAWRNLIARSDVGQLLPFGNTPGIMPDAPGSQCINEVRGALKRLFDGREASAVMEVPYRVATSELRAEVILRSVALNEGTPGAVIIFRDVSDRYSREARIQSRSDILEAMVSACPLGIFTLSDNREDERACNPAAALLLAELGADGPNDERLRGCFEQDTVLRDAYENARKGESADEVRVRAVSRNGQPMDLSISTRRVKKPGESECDVLVFASDITTRVKHESELFAAYTMLQQIFMHLPFAVMVLDPGSKAIRKCSPSVVNMFGYSEEWLTGQNTRILFGDEAGFRVCDRFVRDTVNRDEAPRIMCKMKRKDGSLFDATVVIVPMTGSESTPVQALMVAAELPEKRNT